MTRRGAEKLGMQIGGQQGHPQLHASSWTHDCLPSILPSFIWRAWFLKKPLSAMPA
jgi:hypothetical protein